MDHPLNGGPSALLASSPSRATGEHGQRGHSASSRPGSQPTAAPRVSKSYGGSPQRNTHSARRQSHVQRVGRSSSRRSTSTSRVGDVASHMRDVRVVDEGGRDRTPKALTALRSVGQRGTTQEEHTPLSESSDNFLDRMSSANFSQHGWGSEAGSCCETPHNEPADPSEGDAVAEAGLGTLVEKAPAAAAANPGQQAQQAGLSDAQLDAEVEVQLTESDTVFLFSAPSIVVASETEEGRAVAAANRHYQAAVKAREDGGERPCCVEVQTLNPLQRTREVQSSVAQAVDSGCQASVADIEHEYLRAEEEEDSAAAAAEGAAAGGANVAALAASVAAGGGSERSRRTTGNMSSVMSEWRVSRGDLPESRRTTNAGRVSVANWMPRQGAPGAGLLVQSSAMSTMGGEASMAAGASAAAGGAAGAAADKDAAAEAPVQEDPLKRLRGLKEALEVVDAALVQNVYLPQLLLYRDIKPLSIPLPEPAHQPPPPPACASSSSMATGTTADAGPGTADATPRSLRQESSTAGGAGEPVAPYPEGFCSSSEGGSLQLQLLWRWQCPAVQGRCATCMSWNKAAPDLLAVGYGSFRFGDTGGGMVALWSLKNPTAPLWSFETKAGATSLDWSGCSANLLALGLHDGNVAIYDVRSKAPRPVMESVAGAGKHNDPVWKVKWVDRGADREEVLVSISTDGRVTQWSTAKGLEHTDLMKLKRLARQAPAAGSAAVTGKLAASGTVASGLGTKTSKSAAAAAAAAAGEQDALVSRHSGGMSFDFSSRDHRIYLAGTEDGWIHCCSSSYGDQYLESYRGHLGPVYALQVCPFRDGLFISCGGDWTVRLWQQGRPTPLLTFQTANEEVHDVQWAASDAVVFGAATAAGQLEVWDFSCSTTKPVAQYTCPAHQQATCLLFAPACPVVVCGSSDGSVAVLRLHGAHAAPDMLDLQLLEARLEAALAANVIKTQPGGGSAGNSLGSTMSASAAAL